MKTFICKIKFGLQETTETKTFRFKTKEELNAFYLGLDAAIGYMEYEEIEEGLLGYRNDSYLLIWMSHHLKEFRKIVLI
jgi:hypothetical protein